jgi:NodT family efflux transporter outer membrane factor (OMF) lipoprotein
MNFSRPYIERPVATTLVMTAIVLHLTGCMMGPTYTRPAVQVPAQYKELAPAPVGWKAAVPADDKDRGDWWSVYHDPLLDDLERKVGISNQNLKAFEAAYRQALALADEAHSNRFPTVSAASDVVRSRSSGYTTTTRAVQIGAAWELDLWGRIRRQAESQRASAEASAAQLRGAQLSAQAELATDYFQLRYEDSLQALLSNTLTAYQRTLEITRNQYAAGIAARSDIVAAETQLQTTRAQLIAIGVSRAQFEHAIALLVGEPPSEIAIPVAPLTAEVPTVPVALPSTLLERRPDVAQAERTVARQNALIGAAIAAYYPDISLSGMLGYAGSPVSGLFAASNRVWSAGASANQLLLDGGGRSAAVTAARAAYEQSVANYRQTVLAAFQDVENALSSLSILSDQAEAQASAVALARQGVEIALHEYEAGTQAYTTVVTAQATALTNEETALQIAAGRLTASVALLRALGGGWVR